MALSCSQKLPALLREMVIFIVRIVFILSQQKTNFNRIKVYFLPYGVRSVSITL